MRLNELFGIQEAPLADFQLHGDWSDSKTHLAPAEKPSSTWQWDKDNGNNSFVSRVDRKMVQDISVQSRLRKMFEVHDINFYVYLVNDPKMKFFYSNIDYGAVGDDPELLKMFPEDMRKTIEGRKDGIQVILTHNEGGEARHALTPWMISHRIAHSLTGAGPGVAPFSIVTIKKRLLEIMQYYPEFDQYVNGSRRNLVASEFFRRICTFKSARDNEILDGKNNDNFELFIDAITQYLVKGKVTFQAAPETWEEPHYGFQFTATDIGAVNQAVKDLQDYYNQGTQKALDNCKGMIFIC